MNNKKEDLYWEEVQLWLINHSFFHTFWFGVGLVLISLIFMPLDLFWYIKNKIRITKV